MKTLLPQEEENRMTALSLINRWSTEDPGSLVSRRLVTDRLLDIRNLLPADDTGNVDRILRRIPGLTVVERRWWLDELNQLESRLSETTAGS